MLLLAGGMSRLMSTTANVPPPPWVVSSRHARKANPLERNASAIAAGKTVYTTQCIACHGKTGRGDGIRAAELDPRPFDLSNPVIWLQTDGELFYKTTKGRRPMPTFGKILTDEQIWSVIHYIRTLAPKPTVIGPRYDVGSSARSAMNGCLELAIKISDAASKGQYEQMATAAHALALASGVLEQVTLTEQDKAVERLWKKTATLLAMRAAALESTRDTEASLVAMSKYAEALGGGLRQFGGATRTRAYLFEVSVSDGSDDVWTWIQPEAEPHTPFQALDANRATLVAVFGPKTLAEE